MFRFDRRWREGNYRHAVRLTALIGMGPVVGVRAEKLRVPAVVLDMYERHGAPMEKKKAVIVMSALARAG